MQSAGIVLLGLLLQCWVPVGAVPSFDLNLDLPPKKRWAHVAKHYKAEMLAAHPTFVASVFSKIGTEASDAFLNHTFFPSEYEEELQGFLDVLNHSNLSMKSLKLMNLLYEMQSPTACSGVLWALPNGTVMHGRNMDYSFHFSMPDGRRLNWPDLTFIATASKGGKKLWRTVNWPGSIGVHTGMRLGDPDKHEGWAFQQNTRLRKNSWRANLEAAKSGGKPFGTVVRHYMETIPDFKTAVKKIYAAKFMAPQYFVMSGGGPYEGAVLTIDRLGRHENNTPAVQHVSKSDWHLVQTNDDLLNFPLDGRRPLADKLLNETSQTNCSTQSLMQFMHTTDLFNKMTVFSTVMVPATGYFRVALPTEAPQVVVGMNLLLKASEQTQEASKFFDSQPSQIDQRIPVAAASHVRSAEQAEQDMLQQHDWHALLSKQRAVKPLKRKFLASLKDELSFLQRSTRHVQRMGARRATRDDVCDIQQQ